ncbi:MAG: hypothetical protein AABW61_03115 [Candidatus Aenigmatarchaeota archaeon]
MEQEILKVEQSEELAYFIGVMQGDGYFGSYPVYDRGRTEMRHVLSLKVKDAEMVTKIQSIWLSIFGRKRKIHLRPCGRLELTVAVKTLLEIFKKLDIDFKDPPKPPGWVKEDIKFFGPYLAGVIDADGDVHIKRPQYPQCLIRITSGHPQLELEKSIKDILGCGAAIYERYMYVKQWGIICHSFRLHFLVSSKTIHSFTKHVLPYIQIPRKKDKILKYIKTTSNN